MAEAKKSLVFPGSEMYDDQGNVTHFGVIDPITGSPMMIPHIEGNYAALGGGQPPVELPDNGNGGGDGSPDTPPPGMPPPPEPGPDQVGSTDDASPPQPGMQPLPDQTTGQPDGGAPPQTGPGLPTDQSAPPVAPIQVPQAPIVPSPPNNATFNTDANGRTPYLAPPAQQGRAGFPSMESSSTTSTQHEITSDAQDKLDKYQQAATKANTDLANAQSAEAQVAQARAASESNVLAQQAADRQKQYDDYQQKVASKQQEIENLTDKYANANLDSHRYWNNASTGDKVLSLIAVSLGGLGAALQGPGAKNSALEMIENEVNRDIDDQKFNIEKQGRAISAKRGLLDDFRGQFKDQQAAEDAARATLLKSVQAQYDSVAAQSQEPIIQARAQQNSADLQGKIAEYTAKATASETSHSSQTQPMTKMIMPTADEQKAGQNYQQGIAAIEGAQRKLTDANQGLVNDTGIGGRVKGFLSTNAGVAAGAGYNNLDSALNDAKMKTAQALGRGQMDSESRKQLMDSFPSTKMNATDIWQRLEAKKQDLMTEANTAAQQMDTVYPGRSQYVYGNMPSQPPSIKQRAKK